MVSGKSLSVVIPVLNGLGDGLLELLERLKAQSLAPGATMEVLVIDSGSKDGTPERVREAAPWVRIHEIPNSEFQHGRTRNLGARLTHGDLIVFTVQDALPAHERWLAALTAPFSDPLVAASHGAQIPKAGCNPTVARDITETYRAIREVSVDPVHWLEPGSRQERDYRESEDKRNLLRFFSDVNSCVRRSYWEKHPYPEVEYAEDQIFGARVLENGFKKAYVEEAAVLHSHDLPLLRFLGRAFDDYRGLNQVFGHRDRRGALKLLPGALKAAWKDVRYLAREPRYSARERAYWAQWVVWANLAKRVGILLGGRHASLPAWLARRISLEARKRERA